MLFELFFLLLYPPIAFALDTVKHMGGKGEIIGKIHFAVELNFLYAFIYKIPLEK